MATELKGSNYENDPRWDKAMKGMVIAICWSLLTVPALVAGLAEDPRWFYLAGPMAGWTILVGWGARVLAKKVIEDYRS